MIINIAYEVPKEIVNEIKSHVDYAIASDPSFQGRKYTIERDEYTFIDHADDEYNCAKLLDVIQDMIRQI